MTPKYLLTDEQIMDFARIFLNNFIDDGGRSRADEWSLLRSWSESLGDLK